MTGDSEVRSGNGTALPFVTQDENGDVYFAEGHVDPLTFTLAVVLDVAENVGLSEAKDVAEAIVNAPAGIQQVWWRFDDPNDDEHMRRCAADAEGALAFTQWECV